MAFRVGDEVGNDEKVIDKAHLFYHGKLIVELLCNASVVVRVSARKSCAAELLQIVKAVALALGQLEARQLVFSELEVVAAHVRDLRGVVGSLGVFGEKRAHLGLVLEVKLVGLKFHARRVGYGFLHLHAHQNVLIICVVFFDIVRVVCDGKWNAGLAVDAQKPLGRALFGLKAVILDLKIKAVLAEKLAQLQRLFLCAFVVSGVYHARYSSGDAAGKADKSLGVLVQQLPVYARLVVKALGEGHGNEVAQIFVARFVFAQQDKVRVLRVNAVLLVKARSRRNIDLAADDRLYAGSAAGLVKRDGAVHDAVVGDSKRGLTELLCAVNERLDAAVAVEQRIFGMNMQVNKAHIQSSSGVYVSSFLSLWLRQLLDTGGYDSVARSARLASGFA